MSMLEELDIEERDFEADSWSMAVDTSYLQAHRKDVIKRQDVIYGESHASPSASRRFFECV